MNRKYAGLMIVMLCVANQLSFASQDSGYYNDLRKAYEDKSLANRSDKVQAIVVVSEHLEDLKQKKNSIEYLYLPKIIGNTLAGLGFSGISLLSLLGAVYGAIDTSILLDNPPNIMVNKVVSGPGLGYLDLLKYYWGWDKSITSRLKNEYTQNFLKQLSSGERASVAFGLAAPPLLIGGTFIMALFATSFFNRATSYKAKIAQLKEKINIDESMLAILKE